MSYTIVAITKQIKSVNRDGEITKVELELSCGHKSVLAKEFLKPPDTLRRFVARIEAIGRKKKLRCFQCEIAGKSK